MDETLISWLLDPFTLFGEAEKMASRSREEESPRGEAHAPRRTRSPYGPAVPTLEQKRTAGIEPSLSEE